MFKKVNLESKGYKTFRSVVGVVSGTGAGLTFECMSIPMVCGVFQKNRVLRLICYTGIVPIATIIDLIGKGAAESIVDSFAETYNLLVDKHQKEDEEDFQYVNYTAEPDRSDIEIKTERYYYGVKVPGAVFTHAEQKEFIDELVRKTGVFEFKTEDVAKRFVEILHDVETLHDYAEQHKFATISDALFIHTGIIAPNEVREHTDLWGWKADMFSGVPIDKISDDHWVANLFGYIYVGDLYTVLDEDNNKGDE